MLKLGIVDFDSSHSIEFTRRFNHVGVDADQVVDGARVVLGSPGTSTMSPERIPGFTAEIEACGVKLVDDPNAMIGEIDAVLILSLCGAEHLAKVKPFLTAGVPAYVDKPFACHLADAEEMIRLAGEHNTLLFHSSALTFSAEVQTFHERYQQYGAVHGAVSYGPAKRADGNPGLFHYGIHCVALLLNVMGDGCEAVSTTYTDDAEVVTARWADGRLATLRGVRRGASAYGFTVFCDNGVIHQPVSTRFAYRNLCRAIVWSYETGEPAVSHERNLEEVRFVVASMRSEESNGAWVRLDEV